MSALKTNLIESPVRPAEHEARLRCIRISPNPKETRPSASKHGDFENSAPSGNSRDEWLLVKRATAGDSDAFQKLISGHTNRLRKRARAVLHNDEDAEEALQDGLLSAYRRIGSFEGRSQFSTWLTRVIVNSALMLRRRQVHHEISLEGILEDAPQDLDAIVDSRPDPEQTYGAAEVAALIRKKLGELPSRLQEAFWLREINGLSYEACSAQLGVQRCTLKSRVTRARQRLAKSLRPALSMNIRQLEQLWFES